jgi:hypothetical protein
LVEFAFVALVLMLLTVGLVAGAWLVFQYQGLVDGARAGARAAIVETALLGSGGCESGSPQPVEGAVAAGAPDVPVDSATLCQSASDPQELVQPAPPVGEASVTVVGSPSLSPADLSSVTVIVAIRVAPLAPWPQWSVPLQASSTLAEAAS